MAHLGTGLTITWESGFFAEIISVNGPSAAREAIQTTHMGTTTAHTFTPAELVDWGELSVTIAFDPATDPPIDEAAEELTLTWGNSGANTYTFDGFMTGFEPTAEIDQRMEANCTIKVDGDVTVA